MNVTKEA